MYFLKMYHIDVTETCYLQRPHILILLGLFINPVYNKLSFSYCSSITINFLFSGRVADKYSNQCTRMVIRNVRHMHYSISGSTYICSNDFNIYLTKHWSNCQIRNVWIGLGESSRTNEKLHRDSLGFFYSIR